MAEILDVLDDNGEKTGRTETYEEVHRLGLLHRTVHVWLVNSKNEFLLQKRSDDRRAYPNYWDISAAGHIDSGEISLRAAKRETEEEIGVDFPEQSLKFIATIRQPIIKHDEEFIDNELNDIYLVKCDLQLSEFKLQETEVKEMRWISKRELEDWVQGKGEKIVPHEEEYKILLNTK